MPASVKSAQQIVSNWQQAMSSDRTVQNYTAGINRLTESPTAAAASGPAMQRYLDNVQRSVTSGRRAAALQSVTLEQYKAQATGIGAQRLKSGAQKGQAKMARAMQKWQPIYQQMRDTAASMPKGGVNEAVERVRAVIQIAMQNAGRA
jgi:hypothetical protein